jgi:putative CocE/NonD family hydrolase
MNLNHDAASVTKQEQSAYVRSHYTKYEYQIPARDGAKLFTIAYVPKDSTHAWPIMMKRTPYGIPPYGIDSYPTSVGPTDLFAKEGFIFVYQDTRGRGMSEGVFEDIPPQNKFPNEATDTWDSIEWLLRHLPNHNGKVGAWGSSYNGFTAGCTLIDSHDALKAVSPQAPTAEQGKGDDAYHNGCFCLAAEFNFYSTFTPRSGGPAPIAGWPPGFNYGTPDMYEFFLRLGPLSNANARYFKNANPYWNALLDHPNYDRWWQARSLSRYMDRVKPAVLVVGGWFDAQDLTGPFALFDAIEATHPQSSNTLVAGPWRHSGWYYDPGDTLGNLSFNVKTGEYYREHIELAFFKHHLKAESDSTKGPEFPKAIVFETGTNEWRRLSCWPPAGSKRNLYLREGGHLSFHPAEAAGFDEYVSDPARPVPALPEFTITPPFNYYMTEDQRFALRRPDVLGYVTAELDEDLVIGGDIEAVLKVSTSGTDSDFVVKLIDVYPLDYPDTEPASDGSAVVRRGGYQQLVRGEPFRGKFRDSTLENPEPTPFTPGEPAVIRFRMPAVYHAFRRGHRIMIQIQSSWFPLIDRNPQTFVDIPNARPEDFKKAEQRVYRGGDGGSHIVVNVIDAPC